MNINEDKEEHTLYNALIVIKQYIEENGYKAYIEKYNKMMKDINFNRLEK